MAAADADDTASLRTAALALLVVAPALLAGCSLLQSSGETQPQLPSGEEAADRYENLTALSATMVTEMDLGNGENRSVTRIKTRLGTDQLRMQVLEPEARAGMRTVSNGSVTYQYDPDEDRLLTIENAGTRAEQSRADRLAALFSALNDGTTETVQRPTPGVSPLPVVPATPEAVVAASTNGSVEWNTGNVTARYVGTEQVDGRSTYVVELTPVDPESVVQGSTVWLDTEYLYPLKRHQRLALDNRTVEYTQTVRNVTFNPEFSPDTFEFDPASVPVDERTELESEQFDSREALVAATDVGVPEPDVPGDFRFEGGSWYRNGDRESISLRYTNGTDSLYVSVDNATYGNLSFEGREVVVGNRTALVTSFGETNSLAVATEERRYSVSGTVSNATLARVAESILPPPETSRPAVE
jgi:outer membrane lipoprotein-sorting protein